MLPKSPLLLFCASLAVQVNAEVKPLISTELLYATYDLMVETGTTAWQKAGADALIAKAAANVPMDDLQKKGLELKKLALEKTGPLPPWVDMASLQAQATYVQVRGLVAENVDKVTEPMNAAAVKVIEQFEKAVPKHKGLIPKTAGNLALFVVYASVVLFVLLKVFLFGFRLTLRTIRCALCCVCCCGCCCSGRGGSRDASDDKKKKKKHGSTENNGKTAAAPKAAPDSGKKQTTPAAAKSEPTKAARPVSKKKA